MNYLLLHQSYEDDIGDVELMFGRWALTVKALRESNR